MGVLAIGAIAITGINPAAATADDQSEAEGRILSGGGVVNLNDIAELEPAYSAYSSDPGEDSNPLTADVLNALNIDLGDGLQLFGPSGIVGVGGLAQYANTAEDTAPFASSGAINADGSIAFAPSDPAQNAFLDLTPLLAQAELDALLTEARLELGALSASATYDENGDPVGDYQIADGTLILQSDALGSLSEDISGVLGEVSDPINGLIGSDGVVAGTLDPLLGDLQTLVNTLLLGLGSVDDLGVSVTADVDLQAAVDSVLGQPITSEDSAVTIDFSTGEISIDLARLVADSQGGDYDGTLNNLPVNTEIIGPDLIQAALDGAIGSIFDQIPALLVNAVTDALNSTEMAITITGAVTGLPPLNLPIGNLQINIAGTLGDFVGAEGSTDPVVDLAGTSIIGLPVGEILEPIVQLVTNTLLPALVTPISEAITDEGTLDTLFRPIVEAANELLSPIATLITENLISVTANVQEVPGDFTTVTALDAGSFTQRAVHIELLPALTTPLAELSIASATVRLEAEDDSNANASASAAASANADDDSNAAAEAAAEAAADVDADSAASAAADADATAAAAAAANVDASADASTSVDADANAAAAAAAQAAADADANDAANADASAAATAAADVDAAAAAAAEAASNADSSADASLEASADADSTADVDANANASASAAASTNADDDSNAAAEAAAQAAADVDADSAASAAADADATAAAAAAANAAASTDASSDATTDANAAAAAAAQAAADADGTDTANADASAAATAEADASAAAAAAAEAASNADSSADASMEASADADSTADDDANANASASAAASTNADDDSNAAAEAAAQAAADMDADSAATAAADADATAAAAAAANADASTTASSDATTDANAAAAAAAQAAADADADDTANANASAAATAAANADAAAAAAAEAASNADSSSTASADADSTSDDDSSASADADGDASGLTATVKYERIVRGTGVIQEVYGTGFEAGESVTATVRSTPFTLTANADQNGNVVFSFAVGNDFELGAHDAILVGAVSGEVPDANTDTDFVVVTGGGSGGNNLPDTGSSLPIGFAIGAILLLLLGGAALWMSKIRRGNAA